MKWPWSYQHTHSAADEALALADRRLAQIQEKSLEIAETAEALRKQRQSNHFAARVEQAFRESK